LIFGSKLDVEVFEKLWHESILSLHNFASFPGSLSLEIVWHECMESWHKWMESRHDWRIECNTLLAY